MMKLNLLLFLFLINLGFAQGTSPLWNMSLSGLPETANTIYYGDSVLFYLKNNQITTVDSHTGEALWQRDFDLVQADTYTVLPVAGNGLIFVPDNQTLLAVNERTGEIIWSYETNESVSEIIEDTFNQTGVAYDKGFVFLQTKSKLIALDAESGQVIWEQEKNGRRILDTRVLNNDFLMIYSMALLSTKVGHRPSESDYWKGFYDLHTGSLKWFVRNGIGIQETYVIYNDDESIDLLVIGSGSYPNSLSRRDLKTGETLFSCIVSSRVNSIGLEKSINESNDFALGYPIIQHGIEAYHLDGEWLYTESRQPTSLTNIYRFPFCQNKTLFPPENPEIVNETLERYLHPSIMYYDIAPFQWIAGPFNNYFLFENEGGLYKVPVPQESFTYLYHDNIDDSVYIQPKFADINPPPYELIPDIEGKVVKAELLDGLLLVVLEDGTFQIIDFDSLETILKTSTNFASGLFQLSFHVIDTTLILENRSKVGLELTAYDLSNSN